MKKVSTKVLTICLFLVIVNLFPNVIWAKNKNIIHVWEMKEIKLSAEKTYNNYYMDVTCWAELKGPDFSKRVYGFWDGGNNFIVRVVATRPCKWEWRSNYAWLYPTQPRLGHR